MELHEKLSRLEVEREIKEDIENAQIKRNALHLGRI